MPTALQTVHEFWPFCLRDLEASAPSALRLPIGTPKNGSLSQNSTGTRTFIQQLTKIVTLIFRFNQNCTINSQIYDAEKNSTQADGALKTPAPRDIAAR